METTHDKTGTKEAMRAKREGIACVSPSGFDVIVRPPNIEHHALSGGLPARLKQLAAEGIEGIDKAIQTATAEGDAEMLTYLDGIVARTFVSPEFEAPVYESKIVDEEHDISTVVLVSGDKLDEYLLPADYRWAMLLAFGEIDTDGEGKRLWGREPISRWATFRKEHGCAPDCPSCVRVGAALSVGGAS
jgi:hypothetical protein